MTQRRRLTWSYIISFAEAFWMGTKSNGALFGNVGSLEPGYAFDALVIGGLCDSYENLTPAEQIERFCYMGETRYIKERYIAGKKV